MLTFAGRGYSPEFIANFEQIVERLHRGEIVELVDGPDDVCAPVCGTDESAHCNAQSIVGRDDLARRSLATIPKLALLFDEGHGVCLDAATITDLRQRFASGLIRGACDACEWSPLCSEIAADEFRSARLEGLAKRARPRST